MCDIIKTWPAVLAVAHTRIIFSHGCGNFYFALGRGKPKRPVDRLWWTHRGKIIGSFQIDCMVRNDGSLTRLFAMDGSGSRWQPKFGSMVAICRPPVSWLRERVFHEGFRGWRYFDLPAHRQTLDAIIRL